MALLVENLLKRDGQVLTGLQACSAGQASSNQNICLQLMQSVQLVLRKPTIRLSLLLLIQCIYMLPALHCIYEQHILGVTGACLYTQCIITGDPWGLYSPAVPAGMLIRLSHLHCFSGEYACKFYVLERALALA